MPSPALISFIHIPKTAGSTVRTALADAFPKELVRNAGNSLRNPERSRTHVQRAARRQARLLLGHAPFGLEQALLPPETRYVTMLRDPVDRVLSEYYYLTADRLPEEQLLPTGDGPRQLPLPTRATSVEEMFERRVYLVDNLHTRMLCGIESPYDELPVDAVESATRNLRERFEAFGLREQLDESLVMFGRTLDLGRLRYASSKVNADRAAADEVDTRVRELVAEHNRLDLRLYEAAAELFAQRLAELGDGVSAEVEQLREVSIGPERPEAALAGGHRTPRRTRTRRGSSQPLVALLHVPKTGGSTLGYALRAALTRRGVPGSGNVFRDPERARVRLERLGRRSNTAVRVVAGVTTYGLLRSHLPPGTRYATILREPVDRTLSHYCWLDTADHGADLPLTEMLVRGRLLDNLMTRLLYGSESPLGELPPDALERAKQTLGEFEVVGLTEQLDETIVLIERMLGLGVVPYRSQNVNPGRRRVADLTEEERAVVEEHNRLDVELYAYARTVFDAQVSDEIVRDAEALRNLSS